VNLKSLTCCCLVAEIQHDPALDLIHNIIVDLSEPQQPPLDAIRTKYHPQSKRRPMVVKFEDYCEHRSQHRHPTPRNPAKPWTPFKTRAEFEFSEIVLDAAMNRRQVDALLKVFHRCLEDEDTLDLKDHSEVQSMWDLASVRGHSSPLSIFLPHITRACQNLPETSSMVLLNERTVEELSPHSLSAVRLPHISFHFIFIMA